MLRNEFWWKSEDEAHRLAWQAAQHLKEDQAWRTALNLRHARLYGNADLMGFGLRSHYEKQGPTQNRIALNVVASCVDTLAAKIAKNRPRAKFQTFGGDWDLQQRAKLLDKFIQGKAYELKLHAKGRRCFLDAGVLGTGALKLYEAHGRVQAERVLIEEIRVDEAEGMYGEPRSLFQTKAIAREVLLEQYPDKAEEILKAKKAEELDAPLHGFGDMVEVVEAWHLPSGPKAGDGRHLICIDTATLHDEEWTKDYFPFAFLRLFERLVGFDGQGLAERLTGIQLEINRLLKEITESLRLNSKGRWFLERGAKVNKATITSDIGTIIEYSGAPPILMAANTVPPEVFAQLDRLYQRAYEEAGISQLSARSAKPSGIDSGEGLKTLNDIETERFVLQGQAYEQFFLDATRIIIDMTRDIFARDGKYEVSVPGKAFLKRIDWKDIDLAEDQYSMQAFPVSSLPSTPAARVDTVFKWIQAGWVDAVEGRKLADLPDLEASTNMAVAALEDVDATIDALLDGDLEDEMPEEYQNLALIVQRGNAAYLRARQDKAPEERLQQLRQWIDAAAALQKLQTQQSTQQQAMAAASAQAQPGPGGAPPLPQAA